MLKKNDLRVQRHIGHDRRKTFADDADVMAVLAVAWAWRRRPYKVKLCVMFFKVRNCVSHHNSIVGVQLLVDSGNLREILDSRYVVVAPQPTVTADACVKIKNFHLLPSSSISNSR